MTTRPSPIKSFSSKLVSMELYRSYFEADPQLRPILTRLSSPCTFEDSIPITYILDKEMVEIIWPRLFPVRVMGKFGHEIPKMMSFEEEKRYRKQHPGDPIVKMSYKTGQVLANKAILDFLLDYYREEVQKIARISEQYYGPMCPWEKDWQALSENAFLAAMANTNPARRYSLAQGQNNANRKFELSRNHYFGDVAESIKDPLWVLARKPVDNIIEPPGKNLLPSVAAAWKSAEEKIGTGGFDFTIKPAIPMAFLFQYLNKAPIRDRLRGVIIDWLAMKIAPMNFLTINHIYPERYLHYAKLVVLAMDQEIYRVLKILHRKKPLSKRESDEIRQDARKRIFDWLREYTPFYRRSSDDDFINLFLTSTPTALAKHYLDVPEELDEVSVKDIDPNHRRLWKAAREFRLDDRIKVSRDLYRWYRPHRYLQEQIDNLYNLDRKERGRLKPLQVRPSRLHDDQDDQDEDMDKLGAITPSIPDGGILYLVFRNKRYMTIEGLNSRVKLSDSTLRKHDWFLKPKRLRTERGKVSVRLYPIPEEDPEFMEKIEVMKCLKLTNVASKLGITVRQLRYRLQKAGIKSQSRLERAKLIRKWMVEEERNTRLE